MFVWRSTLLTMTSSTATLPAEMFSWGRRSLWRLPTLALRRRAETAHCTRQSCLVVGWPQRRLSLSVFQQRQTCKYPSPLPPLGRQALWLWYACIHTYIHSYIGLIHVCASAICGCINPSRCRWSYGVTLWEMWSYGIIPLSHLSNEEVIAAVHEQPDCALQQPLNCKADV